MVAIEKFAELYDGAYGKGKVDLFGGQSWDAMMLAVNAYQTAAAAGAELFAVGSAIFFPGSEYGHAVAELTRLAREGLAFEGSTP